MPRTPHTDELIRLVSELDPAPANEVAEELTESDLGAARERARALAARPATRTRRKLAIRTAGLAAAVYGASEGLHTIVLDGIATGGQAGLSTRIENYLGFPAGLSGAELADRAVLQAEKFGAAFAIPAEWSSIPTAMLSLRPRSACPMNPAIGACTERAIPCSRASPPKRSAQG